MCLPYPDPNGRRIERCIIRYIFTGEEHELPLKPHGNYKGQTPYKRNLSSTKDKLKEAVTTKKPKEACAIVENSMGKLEDIASSSHLPRNRQQAANIRRRISFSAEDSNGTDPLLAVIDLARTKHASFIRTIQLNPTPMCILGSKEQLDELIANCTKSNFSVLHVDPTFNLGNYYVTPLVFALTDYLCQRTGKAPTFVGPILIHHKLEYMSYHGFFSQLCGLVPQLHQVKAVGSDGEAALCKAIHDCLPNAIHLRCVKHLKDNIERKLKDMHFKSQATKELLSDIFGTIADGMHELGLADADDEDDFKAKLQSLKQEWNTIELESRSFRSGQERVAVFHEWFQEHFGETFSKFVIASIRTAAGLGEPPVAFYNNRSESINRILKRQVGNQKCRLPDFIEHMHELTTEQVQMQKKADMYVGEWRRKADSSRQRVLIPNIQPQTLPVEVQSHSLSQSYEQLLSAAPGFYDEATLKGMWEKAAVLVATPNMVIPIPGHTGGKGCMVASQTSKTLHLVLPARSNENFCVILPAQDIHHTNSAVTPLQ